MDPGRVRIVNKHDLLSTLHNSTVSASEKRAAAYLFFTCSLFRSARVSRVTVEQPPCLGSFSILVTCFQVIHPAASHLSLSLCLISVAHNGQLCLIFGDYANSIQAPASPSYLTYPVTSHTDSQSVFRDGERFAQQPLP